MAITNARRDYRLIGRDTRRAEEMGLASAQWYQCRIPRKRLKELMQRKDGPAIRDTLVWIASFIVSGGLAYALWPSPWSIPFFIAYGVLYGSSTDSRWHECGHGTAFRTRWMNDVVYHIACFMILREPTVWRWSHTRHHTDTIIVGRDPEIAVPRPPDIIGILLNFFAIKSGFIAIRKIVVHAAGGLTAEEETFIPEMERSKVTLVARIWLAIFAAVALACACWQTLLPAMLIGLPTFYGAWLHVVFGLTQHAGLAEDVLDHRLNSRTVHMNPVFRFIYWNMNYHIEHHMFPMVPYHALPALHEEMRAECPPAYNGLWEAYREIVPAIARQMREPEWHVRRQLPPGASATAPPLAAAAE